MVKILNKAGIEVIFPEGQTCCGAPARYSGAYEVAAQNATDNINALLARGCAIRGLGLPDLHRGAEARLHQHLREPRPDRCPAARAGAGRQGDRLLHAWSRSWWTKAG